MSARKSSQYPGSPIRSPIKGAIPIPIFDDSPARGLVLKDIDELDEGSEIPTLPPSGAIPRISKKTLVAILDGFYDYLFEDLYIIDCRYDYEYEGGHIQGAVNMNSPELLFSSFFEPHFENSIVVFHCEFSHNRGPQIAAIFRAFDRDMNKADYPHLFYPKVFILDGGYKQFYSEFSQYCEGGYTPMLDEQYRLSGDLARATSEFREGVEKLFQSKQETLAKNQKEEKMFNSPSIMAQSPISSKMLQFLASPLVEKKNKC